ncbi:putative RNA helicase [Helianthus anomalus]
MILVQHSTTFPPRFVVLRGQGVMGLMKRLIRLRASNLKLLITSATLDGEKVSKFFSDCPILNVPGNLYLVEISYSSEQPKSYIKFLWEKLSVHPSSVLRDGEEGMLPNYVVYHELISTSCAFMRNVCEVEMQWVTPILQKLEKLNVNKLTKSH